MKSLDVLFLAKIAFLAKQANTDRAELQNEFNQYINKLFGRDLVNDARTDILDITNTEFQDLSGIISKEKTQEILNSLLGEYTFLNAFENIINQLVVSTPNGDKTSQQFLMSILDMFLSQDTAGMSTADIMIGVTKVLIGVGVDVINFENGHKMNVMSYIESVIRTNAAKVFNEGTLAINKEAGNNLVIISSHFGSRDTHFAFQNKVYCTDLGNTKYPYISECGYGTAAGIGGINCSHRLKPYFEGITPMDNVWNKEESDKMYQAEQRQRLIERNIREYKKREYLESITGVDTTKSKAKIEEWQAEARKNAKTNNITRRYDREKIYVS